MPSSLPVPSKAALTALRGLVVGTSCTIALIAEDRRRKINNAVRVIENGKKIKSARNYRSGGSALALAMEEEASWDPVLLLVSPATLQQQQQQQNEVSTSAPARSRAKERAASISGDGAETSAEASNTEVTQRGEALAVEQSDAGNTTKIQTVTPAHPYQPPRKQERAFMQTLQGPRTAPPRQGPKWLFANSEVLKSFAFPTNDEIMDKVHEACSTKDPLQITTALRYVLEALDTNVAPDNLKRPWIETTALLCRTCRQEGRIEDAAKLLQLLINRDPLEETAYFSHDALPLMESLLAEALANEGTRDVSQRYLDAAINLFLPTFTKRPTGPNPQVYKLGRKLLESAFSADRLRRVIGLYRRCHLLAGEDADKLTEWFLAKLHEKQDYKSVVKIFLSTYAKSTPPAESIHALGDIIVHSVESASSYRSDEVLKALHGICSRVGNTKLNPKWVMKLLVSHWNQHGDLGKVEALFDYLRTPSLRETVFRSDNLYRIMVELALEAGEDMKAQAYFDEAVAQSPALASDVRLLGVLARFHAKEGDWETVRADFEAMKEGRKHRPRNKACGEAFVPVLKAYAEEHTVRETEAFLRLYIGEFKVPLNRYMVTLMAKQYAAVRDLDSLLDWLDYCSRAGFPVEAAFTNAILARCRKQWKFPFREMRTLFLKLRALNPKFVDRHTERIMASAALADSKHGGRAARRRLLSLGIDPNILQVTGQCAQVEDVVLAMKEALACRRPRFAFWVYKRAQHLGMPFSPHALQLAVQARLGFAPNDYHGAYDLLQKAQAKGEDINPVVNYLLGAQLGEITATTNAGEALAAVRETLAQFQRCGIRLTESSLHRAAQACLTAGHFRGAVSYALKAAEVRGGGGGGSSSGRRPCFNLQNFRLLLAGYAALADARGIQDTIRRALASSYREDTACLRALKHARLRVARADARSVTPRQRMQARAAVDEGIRRVVEARKLLREQGKRLEAEALRIMQRAAQDAACPLVDFDCTSWTGGGRSGETKRDDGVADELFAGVHYGGMEQGSLDGTTASAVEVF
ncbi:hypothetical protein VTK56DRAFT_4539 [Thermocarpiscus australiensis]